MSADSKRSSRPIRDRRVVGRSIWRLPEDGYVIPRLRPEKAKTEAIGFMADLSSIREDNDER